MGSYLSSPNTTKNSTIQENEYLKIGSSAMQGWRINQEDAHNSILNFSDNTSFFAVYDGHGGSEIAQYCSMKMPDFLKETESFKNADYEKALKESFLDFDKTLLKEEVLEELRQMAKKNPDYDDPDMEGDPDDEETVEEIMSLHQEAAMPLNEVLEKYKGSFNKAATQKDNSQRETTIKAGSSGSGSSSSSSKVEAKASSKPQQQQGVSDQEVSSSSSSKTETDATQTTLDSTEPSSTSKSVTNEQQSNQDPDSTIIPSSLTKPGQSTTTTTTTTSTSTNSCEVQEKEIENPKTSESVKDSNCESSISSSHNNGEPDCSSTSTAGEGSSKKCSSTGEKSSNHISSSDDTEDETSSSSEYDENESPFKLNCNYGSEDDDDEETTEDDQIDDELSEDDEDVSNEEMSDDEEDDLDDNFMNNMDIAPGKASGCTAVVSLLVGRELFVANAGDSRCIVCRGGKVIEMSEDHKPESDIEFQRIKKAGGRVTLDGRVNGGLNLSRAIGDHGYKMNKDLPMEEQMISAMPDLRKISLEPEDEFMVLACDGIWNYMSNEEVLGFVKHRIDAGKLSLSEICEELFHNCLAPNTLGDGTGCDNMTAIIVKFKPTLFDLPSSSTSSTETASLKRAHADDAENDDKEASVNENSAEPTDKKRKIEDDLTPAVDMSNST